MSCRQYPLHHTGDVQERPFLCRFPHCVSPPCFQKIRMRLYVYTCLQYIKKHFQYRHVNVFAVVLFNGTLWQNLSIAPLLIRTDKFPDTRYIRPQMDVFMDGRLGCDNPRVDVNLPIHHKTARFSFGGAEESYRVCKFHIGFIRYHRIAMINAVLTIFSSCTIAISAYTKELELHHIIGNSLFIYK